MSRVIVNDHNQKSDYKWINKKYTLEDIEKLRIKIRNIFVFLIVLAAILIICFLLCKHFILAWGTFVFSLVGITIFYKLRVLEFNYAYKGTIVSNFLNNNFDNLMYDPNKGIDYDIIKNLNIIRTGTKFRASDYLKATYKNITFEFCEINIEDDSNGESTATLFQGQWFIFELNKCIKSNVHIFDKEIFWAKAKKETDDINQVFQKVEVEDIDFNQIFDVYAQIEQEAFYLLTPTFIEKIKEINKKTEGRLLFGISGNKIHVGILNHNNLFEPNIFKKTDINKEKEIIFNQIQFITNFIDSMDF